MLSRAKCFASLDLLMGYHQVLVKPADRFNTAFITHKGLFMYNVMPFSLCNAPATFQRHKNSIWSTGRCNSVGISRRCYDVRGNS